MKQFSSDFEERLCHFGLDPKRLKKEVRLGGPGSWDDKGAPFPVKTIKVSDLDQIKSLIGNPDKIFKEGACKETPRHTEAAKHSSVTPENLKQLAHAYVFGNSEKVKQHKRAIEEAIGEVNLHMAAAETIVIDKELVISGGDSKSIVAKRVVFRGEGRIVCEGMLTLSAGMLVNQET